MINIPNYHVIQQVYESANSFIYRAIRLKDKQPVILKTLKEDYPTPEELTRYRQEYEITRQLADVDGVINAYSLDKYQNTLVMCLEDFVGDSLKHWLTEHPFRLEELFTLAISITNILGQIHQQNIIHKDINPANLIFNPDTNVIKIIDFGIATQLSQQHLTLKNPNVLEGTLGYISPEQTGRMNRALDYRTDFYSLGATFYELFTGVIPFDSTDAMELVHCHIAKQAPSPTEVNSYVPVAISNIIMKLLEKTAEKRYQSAWGIKADLEKCQLAWQKMGAIEPFILAQQDISEHFQIPQKLYGRELEIKKLLATFERVANPPHPPFAKGKNEIMLVAGYSGIGKSALVKEIYKSLTEKRGYFITGKFDQFQRNIPYSALVKAFSELVQQLLTESKAQLAQWKEQLLMALGSNGQVIIDVIPEIEWIIGKQPAVSPLGANESQNRFHLVFQNFMQVFCQTEHPLVIFMDDLQWIDFASLKLLKVVLTENEIQALFIIGAYRDNEVDSTHPLMMTIEQLGKKNVLINQIILKPLNFEQVNQLIADSLHQNQIVVESLTTLVMRKTAGNPFFVNQFLHTLYEEGLLKFVSPKSIDERVTIPEEKNERLGGIYGWQWDIAQIEALNITDNVVELMIGKLKKLPESTQQVLRLAACVGNHFDLHTLSVISEKSVHDTFQALKPALRDGFMTQTTEVLETSEVFGEMIYLKNYIRQFRFSHDRIQQAAYALIKETEKKAVHLKIGQLLLINASTEKSAEQIFEMVEHLNRGRELIMEVAKKWELADLNWNAGKKAKDVTAYAAAFQYLTVGIECLHDLSNDFWTTHYDLSLALHKEQAEVEYLNGHFEQSEAFINLILNHAKTVLEQAEIYNLWIVQYTMLAKYQEAIQIGRKALQLLGIDLPTDNLPTALEVEFAQAKENLKDKTIKSLLVEPEMTIPEKQVALKLLMNIDPPAYYCDQALYPVIIAKSVNLSLQYGNIAESSKGYATYGILVGSILGDYQAGYEFGVLAVKLSEKYKDLAQKCKSCLILGNFLNVWAKPIRAAESINNEGYQAGLESGELQFAGYILMHKILNYFIQGTPLPEILTQLTHFLHFSHKTNNRSSTGLMLAHQLPILNLTGMTADKLVFSTIELSETQYLEMYQSHQDAYCAYNILKAKILYLYAQYTEALWHILEAEKVLAFLFSLAPTAEHHFHYSLILTALYPKASLEEQQQYWQKLEVHQKQMKIWADSCPENFQHKYLLVEAEMARLTDKNLETTLNLYDQAIAYARKNEFVQDEALCNELAAKFWLAKNKKEFAQIYLTRAYYGYQHWGATRKVEELRNQYAQYLVSKISNLVQTNTTISTTRIAATSTESASNWLDLTSVMKASQTLSGEIVLSRLLDKMMHIVIENAGAEKGFLLLPQPDGNWLIEAEGYIGAENIKVLHSISRENIQQIAENIIHYVAHTKTNVLLQDATQEGNFTRDPYIIKQSPKSILCMPLLNQGKLTGILYLENNLTTGAFTPNRFDMLQMLSSQLAVSIENALLYQTLEQKVEQRTAQLADANTQLTQANQKITVLNQQLKSDNLRMSAELDVSRRLQQMLLPTEQELKQIKGLEIAGFMEPANEVGGDYYDVFADKGHVFMGIGDVTGHGLESGALAIMVQSAVRTLLADNKKEPIHFLNALNHMVYHNLHRMKMEKSVTLVLLDYQDGQLRVSGQHEELIVVREGELKRIDTFELGFPIGIEKNITHFLSQTSISLNFGDVVVLYTDGITEAQNQDKNFYGIGRLCEVVKHNWQQTAYDIRQAVIEDVRKFIGEQKVFDDITLLVLKQQ